MTTRRKSSFNLQKWQIIVAILVPLIGCLSTITTVFINNYFDYLEKQLQYTKLELKSNLKQFPLSGNDIIKEQKKVTKVEKAKEEINFKDFFNIKNLQDFISGKK